MRFLLLASFFTRLHFTSFPAYLHLFVVVLWSGPYFCAPGRYFPLRDRYGSAADEPLEDSTLPFPSFPPLCIFPAPHLPYKTLAFFAGCGVDPKYRLDLLAGIAGVPLIHDITERGKIIVAFEAVHAVIDSDKTYTLLAEYFHYLTNFEIVTS